MKGHRRGRNLQPFGNGAGRKAVRALPHEEPEDRKACFLRECRKSLDGVAVLAIISVGGFLGIGDKLVAVPFDQLQLDKDKAILMSSATEEQLKAMPEYKKDQEGYSTYPRERPIGSATR
jgi:hypothetical protein